MHREKIVLLATTAILAGLLAGCNPVKQTNEPETHSNSAPVASQTPTNTPQVKASTVPTTTATATPTAAPTKGYLFSNPTNAGFLSWIEKDNQISGQIEITDTGNSKMNSVIHTFIGKQNGENMSITFNGNVQTTSFTGQTWKATVSDKEVSLLVPDPNNKGKEDILLFRAATVQDYNNAVVNMQTMLQRSLNNQINQSQSAKTETRAASGQKSADDSQLSKDVKSLSDALTELTTASGQKSPAETQLSSDFIALSSALKELNKIKIHEVLRKYEMNWYVLQAHYNQLRTHAAVSPLDSNQIAQINSDLGKMNSVWGNFQSESASLQSMANQMNGYISDALRYTPKLQNSLSAAQKLGVITSATQDLVTAQIGAGNNQAKEFQAKLKDTQQQADAYEANAKKLLQEAEQLVSGLKPSK